MPELMQKSDRDHFTADIARLRAAGGPALLDEIRAAGAARFSDTPFPHYRQEAWRFTNVSPIVQTPFRSVVGAITGTASPDAIAAQLFDEPSWTQLVFVDGIFSKALSRIVPGPKGLRAGSLAEAIGADEAIVRKHLDRHVDPSHAFVCLNSAFIQDGGFVHVPKNTALDAPIHLLYVSTGSGVTAAHPRTLVVLGESANATVVETHVGAPGAGVYLNNGVAEYVLEDNAQLTRYSVVDEAAGGFHLETAKVHLGRDAGVTTFSITLGGAIVRNEVSMVLGGEGGRCEMNGLYLNDGDRLVDNALHVRHAKSRCYSRMSYKGVLDGSSRAVFTGKVHVDRDAQKTDSNQLNNNLLLSGNATIDTKPQLEIFADDVKCTHGATIGGFPSELIFYFRSRGISRAKANGILTYGFAAEVVDRVSLAPLRDRLARYCFNKFSPD